MFCPQCGNQLPESANNCPNCGFAVAREGQSVPPPRPAQTQITNAYGTISNHIALSIIALFFFLPLGIAALIQSTKVDQFIRMGDFETAKMYSDKAKTYGMIGLIIGGILVVLSVILMLVFGTWMFGWAGHYYGY